MLTSRSSQNYLDQLSTLSVTAARRVTVTHFLKTEQRDTASNAAATASQQAARHGDPHAPGARPSSGSNLKAQVAKYTKLLNQLNAAQRAKFLAIKAAKNAPPVAKAVAQAPVTTAQTQGPGQVVTSSPRPRHRRRRRGPAIAVAFALAQIGKPYVFAASGPNAYDCSGSDHGFLGPRPGVSTARTWRLRSTAYGHHVDPAASWSPGDLVFFYPVIRPRGHVHRSRPGRARAAHRRRRPHRAAVRASAATTSGQPVLT